MTVIAIFARDHVPVLLGDFLVTANIPKGSSNFLSTRPSDGPGKKRAGKFAWSTSRKVHRLSERFVVGFTGDLATGQRLVSELAAWTNGATPNIDELAIFLATLEPTVHTDAEFLGWIYDRKAIGFHWRANDGRGLRSGLNEFIAGSGAPHFRKLYDECLTSRPNAGAANAPTRAVTDAIYLIGKMLLEEIVFGETLQFHYGFGGEALYWTGHTFEYLPKVVYFFSFIRVLWGAYLVDSYPIQYVTYVNEGDHAVLQIDKRGDGNTDLHWIMNMNQHPLLKMPINLTAHDMRAPIYFLGGAIDDRDCGNTHDYALICTHGAGHVIVTPTTLGFSPHHLVARFRSMTIANQLPGDQETTTHDVQV